MVETNITDLLEAPMTVARCAESIIKLLHLYQGIYHNLQDIGYDIEAANFFLITLVVKKLDNYTLSRFEDFLAENTEIPTMKELNTFMEREYAVNSRLQTKDTHTKMSDGQHTHLKKPPQSQTIHTHLASDDTAGPSDDDFE